jgi:outer membrane protein TolC
MTTNWRVLLCLALVARAGRAAPLEAEPVGFAAAIERALERNPQAALAAEEISRARAVLEQVRAASLPTLTANGSYTRLDADRVLNGNVILGQDQINGNLQLAAPLLAPRAWAQWAHAQENVRVAAISADEARRQVALLAGRGYLTVLTQKKLVAVVETATRAARAQHLFSVQRFKEGIGTRIDEGRAAQELAVDEAQLATARTGLMRAREALGVLLGAEGAVDAVEEPTLVARALDEATAGVGSRPDVRAATSRLAYARHVVRDSFVDYLPVVNGVFQPFAQDPPSLTIPRLGWQAQLVLSLPLFDGGARYGLRRERSALEREARLQLDGIVRQARAEVRAAFVAVEEAERALASSRVAAQRAEENLRLIETAYRAGVATSLELVDAERSARDHATRAALAEDASRQARLELLAASGAFPAAR